jgi:two-component system NtrC family response regulator
MNKPILFLVDDSDSFLDLFASLPETKEYDLKTFNCPKRALRELEDVQADLIVTDVQMPEMSGIELFHAIQDQLPSVPVIFITAFGSTEQAVEAVQQGAYHYFEKPLTDKLPLFWTTVREALAKKEMQRQLSILREKGGRGTAVETTLVGNSEPIQEVMASVRLVADLPATVLITGETGTGKELVAQLIHQQSGRPAEAFFAVNCGEFSPGVLESELFGHERGAFTGAIEKRMGFFEMADKGTLFLDEIGDATDFLQTKLLRAIETRRFTRVGGSSVISSDFRLITATNHDLKKAVADGRFRDDLLYRIKVYEIHMPPLRDRREDIPLLADFFLVRFKQDYKREIEGFSEAALFALRAYDWPGNVRELINVVERAVILCPEGTITTGHLPFETEITEKNISSLDLMEMEKFYMMLALKRTAGNKSQACQLLGISRKTLIDKVKKYGLERQ